MRLIPTAAPILGGFLALVLASAALANDTALHPGSHGPEPLGGGVHGDRESPIRMVSEHLDIRFGRTSTQVKVRFVFRNQGKRALRQMLGFPDITAGQDEAYRRDPNGEAGWAYPMSDVTGPMTEVTTRVNEKPAPTRLQYGFVSDAENALGWQPGTPKNGHLMAWHVADVAFPPSRDVTVERGYRVQNGANAAGISFFEYITHTGRVWNGQIGKLVADVRLMDGLTVDQLVWKGRPLPKGIDSFESGYHTRPAWGEWEVLSPTHLRLTWKDFEPYLGGDRAGMVLVTPSVKYP